MTEEVIANASPLIALEQVGLLDLPQTLFGGLVVPPAVAEEVAPSVELPEWVVLRSLGQPIGSQILSASLGRGESEALSLALESGSRRILLDERAARRLGRILGLEPIGTLGLLVAAKRRGIVEAVKPLVDRLVEHDFRISTHLYEQVLKDCAEI